MKGSRVIISGVGMHSVFGQGVENFWGNIMSSTETVQDIPSLWNDFGSYNSGIWAPIKDMAFLEEEYTKSELIRNDVTSLLALSAVKEALNSAKITYKNQNQKSSLNKIDNIDAKRIGVFIGTGFGGLSTAAKNIISHRDRNKMNPFVVSASMLSAVSATIGIYFNLTGPNATITQACSSGGAAISQAFASLKNGSVDFAICGGVEFMDEDNAMYPYKGFDTAKTLCSNDKFSNAPFDTDRSGFLFSQGGAGILILEREDTAKERGVVPEVEILGVNNTFDAHSIMSPKPDGSEIKNLIINLLEKCKIETSEVDYINTHGTGTIANDLIEAKIINEVFSSKPFVNSTKSIIGHSFGAASAIEAIVCYISIRNNSIHKNKNLINPIEDINFTKKNVYSKVNCALSTSYAFGGHNNAILFNSIK